MSNQRFFDLLKKFGVIKSGHFVLNSCHSDRYFDKNALCVYPNVTSQICYDIAHEFRRDQVSLVVGPAVSGAVLSHILAEHLSSYIPFKTLSIWADKERESLFIGRGYETLIPNKRVLVVDDVATSGGTVKQLIDLVRRHNGNVVGLGLICNRGDLKAEDFGIPRVSSLIGSESIPSSNWTEEDCAKSGLCSQGIPVNTDLGHGREFLASRFTK